MRKYYKWIPVLGLILVILNITKDDLELEVSNPLKYFGSMAVQVISYVSLIFYFL